MISMSNEGANMLVSSAKRRTNITLDYNLLDEARAFGLNVSVISETALSEKIREAKAGAWKKENADAIAQRNAWVEVNGLPLAKWQVLKTGNDT